MRIPLPGPFSISTRRKHKGKCVKGCFSCSPWPGTRMWWLAAFIAVIAVMTGNVLHDSTASDPSCPWPYHYDHSTNHCQ